MTLLGNFVWTSGQGKEKRGRILDARPGSSVLCPLLPVCDRSWRHDVRTKFPSRVGKEMLAEEHQEKPTSEKNGANVPGT